MKFPQYSLPPPLSSCKICGNCYKALVLTLFFLKLLSYLLSEQRKLRIPSDLGYGSRGAPPKIPADANLVFTTELIDIK